MFFIWHFLTGPQNPKTFKYWTNDELGFHWPILQYQDIAKSLTKGQFAQNLKNGSDIYAHVHFRKKNEKALLIKQFLNSVTFSDNY